MLIGFNVFNVIMLILLVDCFDFIIKNVVSFVNKIIEMIKI